MKLLHTKKFRYGSVSLSITIVIIAAVILLNAIVTVLVGKFGLYIDMTPENRFTLSDGAIALLDGMDHTQEVDIIFCMPEDEMEESALQLDVLETVRDITNRYDNINRKHVDILTNPSAVWEYVDKTRADITSTSVIVASGTEARVFTLSSLFMLSSDQTSVVGYNGEQKLVSAILSVTQAEKPIAVVTVGHGEDTSFTDNSSSLLTLLEEVGYEVVTVNLLKEEIPADARLVVIYDPTSDFIEKNALNPVSELDKLDKFLQGDNSLMVFFDHETPSLPNLESFLDEWGITIARSGEANYLIKDTAASADPTGYNIYANYVTAGLGSSLTSKLWDGVAHPKKVIFPNATAIVSSYNRQWNDDHGYWAGDYWSNGVERHIYDIFTSSGSAVAEAGGSVVKKASNDSLFSFMTVTEQISMDSSGVEHTSYVLACASTMFASGPALDSSYGNHTALAYACHAMGQDVVAVSLNCKYYADTDINSITAEAANQYTVVLTVIPASIIFIAGIYIMVRRKYR